jgi:eukaryotic-like serine/threonine-protein kinase
MVLQAGTRLGPYEVVSAIGAGGMGEVYCARDTRLGREVAIKVLLPAVANDPDKLARFGREAHLLAALNHPNIAHLHGLEESGGVRALVMELVGGPTLADHILQGPIPIEDVIPIARQIAEALEYAHERGIVHRDLKPANIKLLPDGNVKVLDFGLAKAIEVEHGDSSSVVSSPTLTAVATKMGVIMGTAAYMSPEQAKGKTVDRRSDIWSFGCVLFEMLTGQMAFGGETVTDTLAAVVRSEPDWTLLPRQTPASVRRLLERCLRKDVKSRVQAIGDARIALEELDDVVSAAATPSVSQAATPFWKRALPAVALVLAASAVTAFVVLITLPQSPAPAVTRFVVPLDQGTDFVGKQRTVVAVSPDGKMIAFSAGSPAMLYLRNLGDVEVKSVRGSDSASPPMGPLFSPDGRSLAYWTSSDQSLKRIPVDGGSAVTICKTELPSGMTWTGDDVIFANTEGIQRVSSNGGNPERLVAVPDGETAFEPRLLPRGNAILYTLANVSGSGSRWARASVVVQPIPSGARKTLITDAADARYLPNGYIVFMRAGVLYAVRFDPDRLAVSGEPAPVLEGVRRGLGTVGAATANFSVSDTGTLAYVPGPVTTMSTQLRLVLFDAAGGAQNLTVTPGAYSRPRISPDGRRIAFESDDGNEANIWVWDIGGNQAARRLTFSGHNHAPTWSSDSRRVAFESDRAGAGGIFLQPADGTGAPARLTTADKDTEQQPLSWAPDGNGFLFDSTTAGHTTLWFHSMRDGKATRLSAIESTNLTGAAFSPDGRWIAYGTRRRGERNVVYVEPFPQTGAKYQISSSSEDGHHPVWSLDGKAIIYVPGPGTRLMRVPVATSPSFSFGTASWLERPFFNSASSVERSFDLAAGGKILSLRESMDAAGRTITPEIHVVLNWFEELKAKVPLK